MVSQYSNTITFGSLTLEIDRMTPKKVPATNKQVVGGKLIPREIPDNNDQDWFLVIDTKLRGTNRATDRETLESYDDLTTHTFTDGIHDGEYFVVSLEFNDDGGKPTSYAYRLSLIQDQ